MVPNSMTGWSWHCLVSLTFTKSMLLNIAFVINNVDTITVQLIIKIFHVSDHSSSMV